MASKAMERLTGYSSAALEHGHLRGLTASFELFSGRARFRSESHYSRFKNGSAATPKSENWSGKKRLFARVSKRFY
jgi:hypothetical protein